MVSHTYKAFADELLKIAGGAPMTVTSRSAWTAAKRLPGPVAVNKPIPTLLAPKVPPTSVRGTPIR